MDTVSEWLRRWTRNPLGSARRGSNPLGVVVYSFVDIGYRTLCIWAFRNRYFNGDSLAERSKAPDSSSGGRKPAWVRTPLHALLSLYSSAG